MSETIITDVSCVIPTHRRGDYLRDAIRSAQTQTVAPVEIIVVSDVRDAEAEEICRSSEESGLPEVRYVERLIGENGASGSRNHGAQLARGTALAFLDDDDMWEPRFLEECLRAMGEADSDLSAAWIMEFSDQHEKPGHAMRGGLEAADVVGVNPGITGSNFVVRREAFERLGGFDIGLPVRNDTDFFARFMRAGYEYSVADKRLVRQRKHRLGQLTAVDERRARGTQLYIAKHRQYLSRSDRRQLIQLVHRIRSRCAPSRVARLYHAGWVAILYGPIGLVKKMIRGREREVFSVGSSSDGQ